MSSRFYFRLTRDGSPTIETQLSSGTQEKMHNFKGAFSETAYIYGRALKWAAIENKMNLNVFSLGLGLGYNEILSACVASYAGQNDIHLDSFELEPRLIQNFKNWVMSDVLPTQQTLPYLSVDESEVPEEASDLEFAQTYDWILFECASWVYEFDADLEKVFNIKKLLKKSLQAEKIKLHKAFNLEHFEKQTSSYNVILYDAFSQKMSPELWTESALETVLAHADPKSVFATYAAKGVLKRTLSKSGFALQDLPGFGSKRECTFALRDSSLFGHYLLRNKLE